MEYNKPDKRYSEKKVLTPEETAEIMGARITEPPAKYRIIIKRLDWLLGAGRVRK